MRTEKPITIITIIIVYLPHGFIFSFRCEVILAVAPQQSSSFPPSLLL